MFPAVPSSPSSISAFHTDKKPVFGSFKGRWLRIACVAASSSVALPMIGQTARTVTATPLSSRQAVTDAPPQQIVEREGAGCGAGDTDYVIVWTFNGMKGTGKFDISRQQMDIDSFDGHTLVVRRTSYSGGQVGSGTINGTAVYTGHIDGTHITGTASYHPVGGPATEGPWCGEVENPKVLMPEALATGLPLKAIPSQILECDLDQYCDGQWTFNGASGKALWPRNPMVLADLTVESFTPDKIIIRRKDASGNFEAVYTGKLTGNRITGTVAAHAKDKSATANWTASVPATSCIRTDGLKPDAQEAKHVGKIALRFNHLPAALDCYLIAAKNGDAFAQNVVATLYYEGRSPIKQDYAQAFYWVSKSAAQDSYAGEAALAKMYQAGNGTDADPVKAQYWFERAAATPEGRAIAANNARAAQNQALAGLFLGILAGAMDSGDDPPSNGNRFCRADYSYVQQHINDGSSAPPAPQICF